MYTEYVFNIKKYEVAAKEIKATMFDIVASEEAKIGKLRDRAFGDDMEQAKADKLQELYIEQDSLLREFLRDGQEFCKRLQEIDNCSRKLKQIDSEKESQVVATVNENTIPQENQIEEVNQQNIVEQATAAGPVEEIVDEGDALSANDVATSEPVISAEEPVVITETVETPISQEEVLIPEKTSEAEEVVVQDQNNTEPLIVESYPEAAPVSEPEVVSSDIITPVEDAVPIDSEPKESATPEETEEVSDTVNNDLITLVEPVLSPVVESDVVQKPIQETVITGNVLDPIEEQPELNMPVIQENPSNQTVIKSDLTFKKRGNEPAKVIMINPEQALKLRNSLPTQEALLSAAGLFNKSESSSLESQLIDNGLLPPDVDSKQAEIEKLMEQANSLYASGKQAEAEEIYNKISLLSKELQGESEGIVL